ncbi:hypothetical protein ABTY98_23300 [Streptomyces sp. NPDC096040]|uniref:hypothetical protein n=1 Tax=Streptomyces sp. NPDC096040 TaxID=3155541 RepID=UPI0033341F39
MRHDHGAHDAGRVVGAVRVCGGGDIAVRALDVVVVMVLMGVAAGALAGLCPARRAGLRGRAAGHRLE